MADELKQAVESLWVWALGGIGASFAWLWQHITGRVKRLECSLVTKDQLDRHTADEHAKFDALFKKTDSISEKLSGVAESVARIEGRMNQ